MDADERIDAPPATEGTDPPVADGPPATEGADPPVADEGAAGGGGSEGTEPADPAPDYKDLYLRSAAETDNVRKRARRDVEAAQARGVARLARELLPALDNLDRAIAAAEAQEESEAQTDHHLTKGIRLVQQELLGAMARVGIEPYSPEGEAFDPHQHEAIAQQPTEGAQSGTVVVVYQPGYRYGDEVLRAAKVVVAA